MEASRDAAFLGEIAELLESLDAAAGGREDLLQDVTSVSEPVEPANGDETVASTVAHLKRGSIVRRSRQREEIEHLRLHVAELESELARLQHSTGHIVEPPADAVWARVAKRQMSAKQKAQAENAKLKEMLQGQLKVAKGLERLLRKRSNQVEMREILPSMKRQKQANASDDAIFDELKQHVEDWYRELESAFAQNGLALICGDFEDVRVQEDDASGVICLEILHARVLPFDFARVSSAVWECSSRSSIQLPNGEYSPLRVIEDVVTAKFQVSVQVRRQYMTVHVHLAMRRYREPEKQREVYVWESFSQAVSEYKPFDGIQAYDHGWTVVEAVSIPRPDEIPSSIVRCCSRFTPDEQILPRNQPIGAFSDFLISHYNRNYATLFEIVENALLDDELASQCGKQQ